MTDIFAKLYKSFKLLITNYMEKNEANRNETLKVMMKEFWETEEFHDKFNMNLEPCLKSKETSDRLRLKGNGYFMQNKFTESLNCFNESIRYALNPELHPSSKNLSLGYANRSAVLYKMKLFDLCLTDIKRVLLHYPGRFTNKLIVRGVKCNLAMHHLDAAKETLERTTSEYSSNIELINEIRRLINRYEALHGGNAIEHDDNEISNRSVPRLNTANRLYPSVSDALEITFSDKGRGLKAKRDINPGELLIQEKAFASVPNDNCLLTHCSFCMKKVHYAPVPCETCTSVIFCDEECRDQAYQLFHSVECSMLPMFISIGVNRNLFVVFRILCLMDSKTLMQQFKIYEENIQTNADAVRLNMEKVYKSGDIQNLFSLENHIDKRTTDAFALPCIMALLILKLFASSKKSDHMPEIKNLDSLSTLSPEQLDLAVLIIKLLLTASINCQSILEMSTTSSHVLFCDRETTGVGIYLTSSLSNHSCNPNMLLINSGSEVNGVSLRFIKAGTEVCQSYTSIYFDQPLTRIIILQDHYFFTCNCQPCAENWPMYSQLTADVIVQCPECSRDFQVLQRPEGDVRCKRCNRSANDMIVCESGNNIDFSTILRKLWQLKWNFVVFKINHFHDSGIEMDINLILELISVFSKHCVVPDKTLIEAEHVLYCSLQRCPIPVLFSNFSSQKY